MNGIRFDQGPGSHVEGAWKSIIRRAQERRTRLARQSWPEFFKGFAIEVAAVVAIVVTFAVFIHFMR